MITTGNFVRTNDTRLLDTFVLECCGEGYSVFEAFLNLYLKTGNEFYRECAVQTFVDGKGDANGIASNHFEVQPADEWQRLQLQLAVDEILSSFDQLFKGLEQTN